MQHAITIKYNSVIVREKLKKEKKKSQKTKSTVDSQSYLSGHGLSDSIT